MCTITLTNEELEIARFDAEKRYLANRKAKNETQKMINNKCPWHADIIGLIAEVCVAKYFEIPLREIQFTYEQEEFRKIKCGIFDVAQCEVRGTEYKHGSLIIQRRDALYKNNVPFILVIVEYNPEDNTAKGTLKGWATPEEAAYPKFEKTYYTTAYHYPLNLLHSLNTLPEKKKKRKIG